MPSNVPAPGLVPRVKADGSGIEWATMTELVLAVAAKAQPDPTLPGNKVWIDSSAVPDSQGMTEILSESVAVTDAKVDKLAAKEARSETTGVAEAESDSAASQGHWTEAKTETVGVTETKGEAFAAKEPKTETVAATESEADAYTAAGGGGPALIDAFSTNTIANYTLSGLDSGDWGVSGGRLQNSGATLNTVGVVSQAIRTGSSLADGAVEAKVRFGAKTDGIRHGIVVARWVNGGSDYIWADITEGTGLLLKQNASGVTTQLGSTYSFAVALDTDYTVRLTFSGGAVTVSLDGTDRITGTTTRTAAGSYGFQVYRQTYYDSGSDSDITADGVIAFDDLRAG